MSTIQATPQQLADAGAALGRASLFDNRIGEGDVARAAAWAEALAPFGFDVADLLGAVTAHYQNEPQRVVMPADVIRLAREARRVRAERENADERQAREDLRDRRLGLTAGDRQLGSLPIGGADGPPVPGAYEVNGAVDRECPTCHAEAMTPCVNSGNGSPRRIPCLGRLRTDTRGTRQ